MRQNISYCIYSPGGNDTALVQGLDFDSREKKIINDEIMKANANVEQVGFIERSENPKLMMAGGEFCGNASRCAAYYYLNGNLGTLKIDVSGVDSSIIVGVDKSKNAWSQLPHLFR